MLEEGRIDATQMTMLVLGFIIGSAAILVPGQAAGHDQWIAALLALIEAIPVILIFTTVTLRNPGKNMVQIIHDLFGPIIGRIISGAFLLYLAYLASLVMTNYADFFVSVMFDHTPGTVIAATITALCVYAAHEGIEVIARCAMLLLPLIAVMTLINGLVMIPMIRFNKVLPLFDVPVSSLLQSAHVIASFPLNETVVFSMIIPLMAQTRKARRPLILGIVIGSLYLSLAALRIYSELGSTAQIYIYPLHQTVRLATAGTLLARFEILSVVILMAMGFLKITVLLYASALGLSQWAGLRSYRPVLFPLGILVLIASTINFGSTQENLIFAEKIYPIFALPFEIGIPLLALLAYLAKAVLARRRGRKA